MYIFVCIYVFMDRCIFVCISSPLLSVINLYYQVLQVNDSGFINGFVTNFVPRQDFKGH